MAVVTEKGRAMPNIAPMYTDANCKAAYELDWSVAVFWTSEPPSDATWLAALRDATESDGVRVLEHRAPSACVSQFLLSTRPEIAPPAIARSIKGRLQYLVRRKLPNAFHRNYGLRSLGNTRSEVVDGYIRKQTTHHRMADSRVQARFETLHIEGDYGALTAPRTRGTRSFATTCTSSW